MKEDHSYYRGEIEKSKRRLADMEERGIDAMSRFDVEIAYGGNGQMALDQGKQLVGNHISYYSARLEELGPEVRQLDMFGQPVESAAPVHDFYDPEPDAHLEDAYDLSQGEGGESRTRFAFPHALQALDSPRTLLPPRTRNVFSSFVDLLLGRSSVLPPVGGGHNRNLPAFLLTSFRTS